MILYPTKFKWKLDVLKIRLDTQKLPQTKQSLRLINSFYFISLILNPNQKHWLNLIIFYLLEKDNQHWQTQQNRKLCKRFDIFKNFIIKCQVLVSFKVHTLILGFFFFFCHFYIFTTNLNPFIKKRKKEFTIENLIHYSPKQIIQNYPITIKETLTYRKEEKEKTVNNRSTL